MGRFNKYSDGVGVWRRAEKKYLLRAERQLDWSAACDRDGP
jgi:hypothetical protein